MYGKPYKCTVFRTEDRQGRSRWFSLGSLTPIFSESAPLPEHHAYLTLVFLPYRFPWTDFYGPWSKSVRKTVHLYGLPYFTIFPPPAMVPRPQQWLADPFRPSVPLGLSPRGYGGVAARPGDARQGGGGHLKYPTGVGGGPSGLVPRPSRCPEDLSRPSVRLGLSPRGSTPLLLKGPACSK